MKNFLRFSACLIVSILILFPIAKAPEVNVVNQYKCTDETGRMIISECNVIVKYVWSTNRLKYAEQLILIELKDSGAATKKMQVYFYHNNKDLKNGRQFRVINFD